jgi:hypothetical protein
MIRFTPDTWRDAVLRPIAMAAPDSGVYIEIMAPDFRFAAIVLLLVVWVGTAIAARVKWRVTPTLALLSLVSVAFVPWLATTGNGRYFIPILLATGPLCVALIYHLPCTKSLRLTAAIMVLCLQGFAVYSANPWQSWGWVVWNDKPFFPVEIDKEAQTKPATYITVSSISYSLIAPRFAPGSRWSNVASQSTDPQTAEWKRLHRFLSEANSLKLLVPTVPNEMTAEGLPNQEAFQSFNGMLGAQKLAMAHPANCRLLRSIGIAEIALRNMQNVDPKIIDKFGFWICDLKYSVTAPAIEKVQLKKSVAGVFAKLETVCPRIFQTNGSATQRLNDGFLRFYSESDSKVYVLDDGNVFYKYYRALNPVLLGTTDAVLSDQFKMDCNKIHGRSGLPWERSI